MRLNNWSIAASYDTARIFAGLGFGSSNLRRIRERFRMEAGRGHLGLWLFLAN
jgi:hypothetical protein